MERGLGLLIGTGACQPPDRGALLPDGGRVGLLDIHKTDVGDGQMGLRFVDVGGRDFQRPLEVGPGSAKIAGS